MLKEGVTISFKTIKISYINTAYPMSLTSERDGVIVKEGHVMVGQKVNDFIIFVFFLFQYTAILHGYF